MKKKAALRKKQGRKQPVRRLVREQEIGLLGQALRKLGGAGGTALGGMFGLPIAGGAAGHSLGAAVSRWLGSGDYSVSTNSIVNRVQRGSNSIPSMHKNDQSIVVSHKEYLGEVRSNQTFTVNQSFPINPGVNTTFPWLSLVASRFQEYRMKGMVFHYVPSSGSAISGTNNALGTVMMQTSYRSNDTAPASKVEMLNEYWSSESVPSEPFAHPIECNPAENPFNVQYVRTGLVPTGDNQLIYDLGVTHIATSGQQASNVVLGDLWVSYEVELKKPLIDSNATDSVPYYQANFTAPTQAAWFSGGAGTNVGNLAITTNGANTLIFPKGSTGSWGVLYRFVASTVYTVVNFSTLPTLTNCTPAPLAEAFTQSSAVGDLGSNTDSAWYYTTIQISDPSVVATVQLPSSTVTGASTRGTLHVLKLS